MPEPRKAIVVGTKAHLMNGPKQIFVVGDGTSSCDKVVAVIDGNRLRSVVKQAVGNAPIALSKAVAL